MPLSGILDSNQRPQRPERRALPAALIPVKKIKKSLPKSEGLARAAGLEPAISGVTGQRDNQLRYARVMFFILLKTAGRVNRLGPFLCKILRVFFLDFVFLCIMAGKMLGQGFFCSFRIFILKSLKDLFMFVYNPLRIK